MKDFLSISDIQAILQPLENSHFMKDGDASMQAIYQQAFDLINGQTGYMTRDLMRRWKMSEKAFAGNEDENNEYLHIFAFICLLSFDVYVKKKLIETLADELNKTDTSEKH